MPIPEKFFLYLLLFINFILIVLALIIGENIWDYFDEGGFITYWSAFQLAVVGFISGLIFFIRNKGVKKVSLNAAPFIWAIMAAGFLFLTLDEIFLIHERTDRFFHYLFQIEETNITDRLDDLIIGFYGIIGLSVLYYYRGELMKFKPVFALVVIGYVLLFITVVLDMVTNRSDVISYFITQEDYVEQISNYLSVMEESCKLYSVAFFLGAFYYSVPIARSTTHS